MSTYKSFAVVGSGGIAKVIATELARKPGTTVKVLSRSASQSSQDNVEVKVVDYSNAEELKAVLKGVQVVISAVGSAALATPVQYQVADAAKAAGVQLFLPSEFGNRTHDLPPTDKFLYPLKTKVQEYLRQIGLNYLLIYNGPFPSDIYNPRVGFDFASRRVDIVGDGNNPVPQTTRQDVARFVAHVLTTQDPQSLANKHLDIRGDLVSFNHAVELWRHSHDNAPVEVRYTSISDAREQSKAGGPSGFLAYLRAEWAESKAVSQSETANDLFPDWNPSKVEQFLAHV
ncbi:hypothetical protein OIO90_000209 [Microbotryomycetes sp. JL221]|nr:hypothetical protein OIO90_000209 [Microbotryomycetes sp. JL221]